MTSVAQSGLFGFGPQPAKDTLAHAAVAPVMYRHRAADIDLSAIDDVRIGPNEVGGIPTPTFPYKAGQLARGGATIYPRLANTFGWLLHGALGKSTSTPTSVASVLPATALTVAAQTGFTTGLVDPAALATVKMWISTAGGALQCKGPVTLHGTDVNDAALVETVYLSHTTPVFSANKFKTVDSVDLPAWAQSGDEITMSVGSVAHVMKFNDTEGLESKIPWMTFYKYVPGDLSSADPTTTDIYEIYKNCKVTGLTFTLPNDGPIAARVDVQGTGWEFADSIPLAAGWTNSLEDYLSIPVGCNTGGYIKIPSYSNDEIPIVSAQVGIVNTPLDLRQEKTYGSPELDDITIITRALSLDMVCKWKDPGLYRKIYTNSAAGTVWSERPFVQTLDIMAQVSFLGYDTTPWSLRIQCPSVLFQIQDGIRLAGNNVVTARLTGQALAPGGGDYVTMTLTNMAANYTWPTT